jgi:hypothetical protein
MERSNGHTAARKEAEIHDPDLAARAPDPVEGAWQADVRVWRLFNENREPRALQGSLHRHASGSEDTDIVDQMLRPDDGDIQVGVSVMGWDGKAPGRLA